MSVDKISKLITSVAKTMENNEKVALPLFSVKLQKFAEQYPHDATIASVNSIVKKLADKRACITRGEVKDLYKRFYSRNTKFASFFADELNIKVEKEIVSAPKQLQPNIDIHSTADPILSNALESVFDKSAKVKMYSKLAAEKAINTVNVALDVWGVAASKLEIEDGNNNFIVVKASYETPKGMTSVYVPVEILKDKIVEPEIFVANAGPSDINNKNITAYIKGFAGQKLAINSSKIMEKLSSLKNNEPEVNNVEMAIIKLNASRGHGELFANQILDQSFDAQSVQDVKLADFKDEEATSFAAQLETPAGVAGFKFGNDKVKLGREIIARNLTEFKAPQVAVADCSDTTIVYAVSLNNGRVAFKVPVKIEKNKVHTPEIMISNGSVSSFSKANIDKLFINNETDYSVAAAASPLRTMKSKQLVEAIKIAIVENNLLKAEDALNVLSTMNDSNSYQLALSYFINNVGMNKQASAEHKCSMIINASNSKHPVCGHTGLPTHKVYQDDHGNCLPLYRKASDGPGEGAFFMNSKIFG
jgi:hypothetical protein